ncbi:armadillo-type protein [Tribonema minus]|uniref:Armadillo-type protein n=1 Tax=Tribonema minus TaxID=303371 RepID=A0A835YK41_9STRA|nr:armadillo-type protein [Tribonema minus]
MASHLQRLNGDVAKAADWELCLSLLRTKNSVVQARAAKHLRQYMETAVREMSSEAFGKFEGELYQRIFALVRANDLWERLGGVMALDELIDASSAAAETKIIKFSNNLSNALRTNTDHAMLVQAMRGRLVLRKEQEYDRRSARPWGQARIPNVSRMVQVSKALGHMARSSAVPNVSKALGHMARSSAVPNVDYVEFEVNRGLEWLNAEQWHRRLAACLVLRELAANAPTTLYVKIRDFFERAMPALADAHEAIRVTAAEALATCLAILAQRRSRHHLNWYCSIYDALQAGLAKGGEADIHGALLIAGAMLDNCSDFMVPRFREVCDAVMQLRGHKSRLVRTTVTSLLPRLAQFRPYAFARARTSRCAQFCPDAFARAHLEGTLDHLMQACAKVDQRAAAFLALGKACAKVHQRAAAFLALGKIDQPAAVFLVLGKLAPAVRFHLASSLPASAARGACGEAHDALLARAVRFHLASSLPALAALVREGLAAKRKTPSCLEALACVADLVEGLGSTFAPYVDSLVEPMFATGLSKRGVDGSTFAPYVDSLVEPMFATGLSTFAPYVDSLVEPMFATGLSEQLIETLAVMEQNLPSHQVRIQRRLLRELSVVLAGAPYEPPGSYPPWLARGGGAGGGPAGPGDGGAALVGSGTGGGAAAGSGNSSGNASSAAITNPSSGGGGGSAAVHIALVPAAADEDLAVLALHTLGTFRLDSFCLLPLVRDCVVGYLGAGAAAVRREAALTCCQLLAPPPAAAAAAVAAAVASGGVAAPSAAGLVTLSTGGAYSPRVAPTRGPSALVVEEVLQRLLHVAVSDPHPGIRQTLLRALDQRFDGHLCQAHHLQTLFLLLGDEDFLIRLDAVTVLGRLAALNPAYLLPPLRQTLMQLIVELRYNTDTGSREEATRMLCHFLRRAAAARAAVWENDCFLIDTGSREEATRMLCHFLRGAALQWLVPPFLGAIIAALPLRGNARLATAALEALGELSLVARDDMAPHLEQLIPLVVESMQDQPAALEALGELPLVARDDMAPHLEQLIP